MERGIISITHNTIFLWGKQMLKSLTIYIALTKRSEKKIQCLFNLNNSCKSTIYLYASQTSSSQYLAKFATCEAPTSLRKSKGIIPYLIWKIPHHNYTIHHRPSIDCMHHLYNSQNYTTNSTLSLNSNLNWVFLRTDMHELFWVIL